MAGFKPAVALLLCAVAFALSCSTVSAADAAPAVAKSVLKHPLGSGLNSPVSLNLTPKRGRRFLKLMQQFVEAARGGKFGIAQQIQQQLFAITRPKRHRRHLLQEEAAEDACPVFADTLIDEANPPLAGTAASGDATTITQPANETTGPLPTIRFATLEPCAEYGCRTRFRLTRRPDGTIFCRELGEPADRVEVEDFAYFQVYDYDLLWDTDADNIVSGLYAGSVTSNTNELTSSRGAAGGKSTLATENVVRGVINPLLGFVGDSNTEAGVSTDVELSRAVGDVGVLTFTTQLPAINAAASYAAVLPGAVATEREVEEASDDNVVFRTNTPALYAFGKKH